MFDCANVEMRELLPDLAAGSLDSVTRARVEAHIAGCAECASELETIRLVRGAFAAAPVIDARRIVAALPSPAHTSNGATTKGDSAPRVKPWVDWRVAAALTVITIGGLSVAVDGRIRNGADSTTPRRATTNAIDSAPAPIVSRGRAADTVRPGDSGSRPGPAAPNAPAARAQLSFGGGVSDLDTESIEALLGALEEIDRAPIAPSAEPDRAPVLPVIREGGQ